MNSKTIKLPESKLTKRQRLKFGPKVYTEGKETYRIVANVRHDDECGNGHNSFSITAEILRKAGNERWVEYSGGCCHDEVAKHFPELAPFIKWHLTSTDGPMHYLANVIYHAGDRDHNGKRAGEASQHNLVIQWKGFPIKWRGNHRFMLWLKEQGSAAADCEVLRFDHDENKKGGYQFGPKYTLGGFGARWHECPFDTEEEALEFLAALRLGFDVVKIPTAWSEGKKRELDHARSSAVWPEATDEQLCAEPEELKRMLLERLPALMEQFKKDVESLGLVY